MELQQTLSAMMAQRPTAYRALLDDVTEVLRQAALSSVLKAGDPMPDFVLPDANGELVCSDDLLRKGPLVVVFFRGEWCPFCRATLTALNDVAGDIEAAGGTLVALSPDVAAFRKRAWHAQDLRFPVLNDVDGAISLQFGTLFRIPDRLRSFYLTAGIDLTLRHGDPSWFLPMPATFIAGSDGVLRFAHASGDITDRVEPVNIISLMRTIVG
jgi:peroxiredoxin